MRRSLRVLFLMPATMAVKACIGPSSGGDCPHVLWNPNATELSRYAGAPSASHLLAEATLSTPSATCESAKDGETTHVSLKLNAARGPAMTDGGSADFPYYIALIAPGGNEVSRQTGSAHVIFPGSAGTAEADLTPSIRIYSNRYHQSGDYHIVAGFVLTDQELADSLSREKP